MSEPQDHTPTLLGSHRLYNLVQYGEQVLALPQALGHVDLADPAGRANPYILVARDAETACQLVDQQGAWRDFDPLFTETPLEVFGDPEVIEIEPIHTCNLRCVMCHVSYERMTKQRLDIGFLKHMHGLKGRWAKLGSLYEPVAHPQFAEIAKGLTELGMDIDLVTNGTLFTPQLIEKIADCRFRNVTISFDGVRRETYETIRRRGDYDMAVKRILAFKQAVLARRPDTYFQVNFTILRSNIAEIAEAVDFWEGHGFDHIGFISMVIRDEAEVLRRESVQPVLDDVAAALDEAARRVVEGGLRISLSAPRFHNTPLAEHHPEAFSVAGTVVSRHPEARLPRTPSTYFQNGSYPGMPVDCRSPFKFARINYNGDVQLCYQFSIGNIADRPLLELWRGAEAQAARSKVQASAEICHDCEYYRFCIQANTVDAEQDYVSKIRLNLLEESWPYNFLSFAGRVFAVPQWLEIGMAELSQANKHTELGIVSAESLELARLAVADRFPPLDFSPPPSWMVEAYRGYNLFAHHDRMVAVPERLGPLNVSKMIQPTLDFRYWFKRRYALQAPSLIKMRKLIDQHLSR